MQSASAALLIQYPGEQQSPVRESEQQGLASLPATYMAQWSPCAVGTPQLHVFKEGQSYTGPHAPGTLGQ